MLAKDHAAPEAVSERYTPFYGDETSHFITSEQRLNRRDKMSRHFMGERFDSKSTSTPFSSRLWAIYLIQMRHDIEEMTTAHPYMNSRAKNACQFFTATTVNTLGMVQIDVAWRRWANSTVVACCKSIESVFP